MQPYSAMRISASGSIGGRGRLHAKIKIYCERNAVPLRTPSRSPGCSADFQFRLLGHQLTKLLLLESPTAVKHQVIVGLCPHHACMHCCRLSARCCLLLACLLCALAAAAPAQLLPLREAVDDATGGNADEGQCLCDGSHRWWLLSLYENG